MEDIRFFVSALVAVVASGVPTMAQFVADPGLNLAIADRTGPQVQPKVSVAPDGTIYVAWFDNAAGGYDVYLQHLSATGEELWEHNGVLVADRSYSSTQDYDLRVDAAGNAVLAFNDNRSGTDQITVTKVAPDGSMPWGSAGTTVSSGTSSKGFPRVAVLSDGSLISGWSESATAKLQLLSADGAMIGATQTIEETGHQLTLSDLQAGDNGTFIALWVRTFNTNFMSSKYLYTQKFDQSFTALWPVTDGATALVVYGPTGGSYPAQGGSIQIGYFPGFVPDGQGGAVYGWYENAGPRSSYVQHIDASGVAALPANGLSVTVDTPGLIKTSAGLSYDRATGDIFLGWTETNGSTQSQFSVKAQKVSGDGTREWGDLGATMIDTNPNQSSFVRTIAHEGGCYVACFDARSATTGVVVAERFNADGTPAWGPVEACTRDTTKSRLDATSSATGQALLVWGDGTFGDSDVYIQDINADGTFGNPPSVCAADFNGDTTVNSQDFFDFLNAFFMSAPSADFNHDAVVNSQDFFDFLNAFFIGC
jgi:hypothetical protein